MKKLFTMILAIALLALPMTALGEGETLFGRFTLADPVLSVEGQIIDLTGLNLMLTGAYDLSNTDDPQATLVAQVTAQGQDALSAAITIDKEKVVGILNGLSAEYGIYFKDIIPGFTYGDNEKAILDEFVSSIASLTTANMMMGFSDFPKDNSEELLNSMDLVDEGTAEITFGGESVTAQKMTMSFTPVQFRQLIVDVYSAMGVDGEALATILDQAGITYSGTITMYVVDENAVKMVMGMDMTAEGEKIHIDMDMEVLATDERNATCTAQIKMTAEGSDEAAYVDMTMDITGTDDQNMSLVLNMDMSEIEGDEAPEKAGSLKMTMDSKSSDVFTDAVDVQMTMDMIDSDGDAQGNLRFSLVPVAYEGGFKYEYNFAVQDGSEVISFGGNYADDGSSFRVTFNMSTMADDGDEAATLMSFEFGGNYAGEGLEYTFDGDLKLAGEFEGVPMEFSTKLMLEFTKDVEGRLLSMGDLSFIDASTLDEAAFEALEGEAAVVLINSLSILQQLPGVAALLEAASAVMG